MIEMLESQGCETLGVGSQAAKKATTAYRQVDLLDYSGLCRVVEDFKPTHVVHLAAVSFVAHGDASAIYQVNVIGTRNLLEALVGSGIFIQKVIVASSANVYGNTVAGRLDETSDLNPANDYGVSKVAVEYLARTYMEKLPIVVTRPFNYTGVGQHEKFLIPKIVRHFRERKAVIELGNIDVWRDFNDVRSLVAAYSGLLHKSEPGKAYNIASGNTWSLRQIIAVCEEVTQHSIEIKVNPAFVRENEVKSLCGDIGKLSALLPDWKPVPLTETLSWMLDDG
jgi:nucleoside-diphosphate-sugar epimerase